MLFWRRKKKEEAAEQEAAVAAQEAETAQSEEVAVSEPAEEAEEVVSQEVVEAAIEAEATEAAQPELGSTQAESDDAMPEEIASGEAVAEVAETETAQPELGSTQAESDDAMPEEIASEEAVAEVAEAETAQPALEETQTEPEPEEVEEPEPASEPEEVEEPEPAAEPEEENKGGFFRRLVSGLAKTRKQMTSSLTSIFSGFTSIDEEFYEELEEILVMADVGIGPTTSILDRLREQVREQHVTDVSACRTLLMDSIKEEMALKEDAFAFEEKKSVVLVIGVNGVGKTTTIGKLAGKYRAKGKKVLLAAGDTFRSAASEQLTEWAKRSQVDIIVGQDGSDPAAVLYDSIQSAKAKNVDILLCDTAGRLHNKKNLMNELHKMKEVVAKEYADAHMETLLVLDGTTGQNALVQAKEFLETVGQIDGIVLTKLDGTAKGGMAIAIISELKIPIKYIGVGEKIEDLQPFDADQFIEALFATDEEHEA